MAFRICARCGATFPIKRSELRRGGGKHCSMACYNATRSRIRDGRKLCAKCGEWKPLAEFWLRPDRQRPMPRCKRCTTEDGRPYRDRYATGPKGRAAYARSLAKRRKDRRAGDVHTPASIEGRAVRLDAQRRWRARNLEHARVLGAAAEAVRRAVAAGRLQRPTRCSSCGREATIHAHHHNGYDKAHHLDVRWLCVACHEDAHHGPLE